MAHEIDFTTGKAAMAYVGDTPWHGLGQKMEAGKTIDEWKYAAGMNFSLESKDVLFETNDGNILTVPDRKVLVRSDNQKALGVVSHNYKVVQPGEVLEFYRDLTESAGFQMETAGVLRDGRKYWALANMGQEAKVLDDTIKGYLLLGTACDGSMSTVAMFTSIRVVCNNTLTFAVEGTGANKGQRIVRINHRSNFNETKVKAQLGLAATSWDSFIKSVDVWSKTKVDNDQAHNFFSAVSTYTNEKGDEVVSPKTVDALFDLYQGRGMGSDLEAARKTVWGLINAVTEHVDHHRGRTDDVRIDRAWFGDGQTTKELAVNLANQLVAA